MAKSCSFSVVKKITMKNFSISILNMLIYIYPTNYTTAYAFKVTTYPRYGDITMFRNFGLSSDIKENTDEAGYIRI